LHTWHGPLQAIAQQRPSVEQNPLAQLPPSAPGSHGCAFAAAHVCAAEQAWFEGHSPFEPTGKIEQLAPPLHDWQSPLHASAQQMPSAEQNVLAQSLPSAPASQGCAFAAAHLCAAEQAWLLPHSLSVTQSVKVKSRGPRRALQAASKKKKRSTVPVRARRNLVVCTDRSIVRTSPRG
jgi:hypothetical protein